jgi:hypothetical protein
MAKPRSWKPGQSGNPKGRPKKEWTMAAMYKQAAEETTKTGEPKYKIIARKLLELAEKGDMVAIKEFGNRIDGLPKQNLDVTSDGKPIPILGGVVNVPSYNSDQKTPKAE